VVQAGKAYENEPIETFEPMVRRVLDQRRTPPTKAK
jgi:hypothetical protein